MITPSSVLRVYTHTSTRFLSSISQVKFAALTAENGGGKGAAREELAATAMAETTAGSDSGVGGDVGGSGGSGGAGGRDGETGFFGGGGGKSGDGLDGLKTSCKQRQLNVEPEYTVHRRT